MQHILETQWVLQKGTYFIFNHLNSFSSTKLQQFEHIFEIQTAILSNSLQKNIQLSKWHWNGEDRWKFGRYTGIYSKKVRIFYSFKMTQTNCYEPIKKFKHSIDDLPEKTLGSENDNKTDAILQNVHEM